MTQTDKLFRIQKITQILSFDIVLFPQIPNYFNNHSKGGMPFLTGKQHCIDSTIIIYKVRNHQKAKKSSPNAQFLNPKCFPKQPLFLCDVLEHGKGERYVGSDLGYQFIFSILWRMAFKKINGYIIHLKEILGKGSYGQVYRGEQEITKRPFAIKVLTKMLINADEYLRRALMQEIQILQQVKSKNIVTVHEVMESTNNYYMILQLCDCDLEKYMKLHPNITETQAIEMLKQIVNGFVALIREGIIHRDMKPANILVSNGEMKLADFGFAKKNVTKKMKSETTVGTPLYMSLELLKGEPYSSKCDIWAVGFMFYEMLHHRPPWSAQSVYELIKEIEGKPLVIDPNLSAHTQDFLRGTLALHEKDRLEWDQVFAHPIFGGAFDHYKVNNQKIEDKLKVIMNRLRFKINSENLDIPQLFSLLGFQPKRELGFEQFHRLIDYISPKITPEEVRYFFDRIDYDSSGNVSLDQIEKEINRHIKPGKQLDEAELEEPPKQLPSELAQRVKACFQRLHRVLSSNKISLKTTFNAYDKDCMGSLSLDNFRNMMGRLDSKFTGAQISSIFQVVDANRSKAIEFQDLQAYYCEINHLTPGPEFTQSRVE